MKLQLLANVNIKASFVTDGDFLWTMTSRGHFFTKWANSSGRFLRVNSHVHFLCFLVDIFWVNSSGHF